MPALLPLLFCLACAVDGPGAGPPADAARGAALAELRRALETGAQAEVATAAKAASAFQGQDPALDRALGDALANHLLRAKEGAALLRDNPAPQDPDWRRAALDAALRSDDRAWLASLLGEEALDLELDHPVVDEVVLRSRQHAEVDHRVLLEVVRDCMLLDGRPQMGLRSIDLPVPPTLDATLALFGPERVLVARTQYFRPPSSSREEVWQCRSGWIPAGQERRLPADIPPRGIAVAVTDGQRSAWFDVESTAQGPWATVGSDPSSTARWLLAAALMEERLAAGDSPEAATARVLERHGPGLFAAGEAPTAPPTPAGAKGD